MLTEQLETFGVTIERGTSLVSFEQHPEAVNVTLEHKGNLEQYTCTYLAGCDGAHSAVRKGMHYRFCFVSQRSDVFYSSPSLKRQ